MLIYMENNGLVQGESGKAITITTKSFYGKKLGEGGGRRGEMAVKRWSARTELSFYGDGVYFIDNNK